MTPRYYYVAAQRVTVVDGWARSEGLPAFVLDAEIQGIVSVAHAERVALSIVEAGGHVVVTPHED